MDDVPQTSVLERPVALTTLVPMIYIDSPFTLSEPEERSNLLPGLSHLSASVIRSLGLV
jgi:hypothetical protein